MNNNLTFNPYFDLLAQVVSISEASELYGVNKRTILDWCYEGKIAAAQMNEGRAWLIAHDSLREKLGLSPKHARKHEDDMLLWMHRQLFSVFKNREASVFKVIVQIADFLLKAAATYIETDEGRKEWQDIVDATKPEAGSSAQAAPPDGQQKRWIGTQS